MEIFVQNFHHTCNHLRQSWISNKQTKQKQNQQKQRQNKNKINQNKNIPFGNGGKIPIFISWKQYHDQKNFFHKISLKVGDQKYVGEINLKKQNIPYGMIGDENILVKPLKMPIYAN